MLSQANLLANKSQALEHWGDSLTEGKEVFLAPLPLYHIYGFTMHCMVLFSLGAESVLVPNPRELKSVIDAFKKNTLTGMVGLNTLFVALTRNQDFRELDFSSLEKTVSGGMALTDETANIWEKLTGSSIVEGYGLTETSPIVTSNDPKRPRKNTIGVALPSTELKVINDDGESLPSGEAGELCVRGPQVMMGYWLQAEATAEVLTSEGWLRTGDIAVIENDGYVRIVDRKKDMIIVSGFNVYPNEVENILVTHSDIVEAAVVGVPDDVSGEVVKAFVVKVEGSKLDFEAIRAFCQLSLTSYKIPRLYEFRDALPKTNVGKILRRELRDAESDDV
jgi:long-chain acyl-CoA synthetase